MLFLGCLPASLALDLTAPVELTVALLYDRPPTDDEPPSAAEHTTPVAAHRRPVASPARRARPARLLVRVAEVGRCLEVDEIRRGVGTGDGGREVLRDEVGDAGAQADEGHLDGGVELVPEDLTDVSEVRKGLPAGLQLTGSGYTVTLATHLRVV